jgi:hypothetical protein
MENMFNGRMLFGAIMHTDSEKHSTIKEIIDNPPNFVFPNIICMY